MFESDDADDVLSQIDITELLNKNAVTVNVTQNSVKPIESEVISSTCKPVTSNIASPKHVKRNIINSHFDRKTKRKFPGPAGLLTGNINQYQDENECHVELLSQDINFTQSNLRTDLFDSPIWIALLDNVKEWNLSNVDLIKSVKQQAIAGNLCQHKANIITAFVETVDRSVIDPLVTLRDTTGTIKCTLHRDAWSKFSPYILAECCALVLWKPTVLTTGGAFKRHYLNITLSNILAVYSSAVLNEEDRAIPDGYSVVHKEEFLVLKTKKDVQDIEINSNNENINNSNFFEDLEMEDIFSDEMI